MQPALAGIFESVDQLFISCEIDFRLLKQQSITGEWLKLYDNQRVVNSFLFNYIKIQDKLGAKLFRNLLFSLREIEDPAMPMIDILNRMEKLNIIDDAKTWDKLREIRNSITHEYPLDIAERLDNIELALAGYVLMQKFYNRIKAFTLARL